MSDLKCIQTPVRLPAHKKWRLKVALKVTLSISQPGRKFVKDDVLELCLRDTSGGIRVHKSPMVSFVGPTSNNTSVAFSPFLLAVISLDKGSCFLFEYKRK